MKKLKLKQEHIPQDHPCREEWENLIDWNKANVWKAYRQISPTIDIMIPIYACKYACMCLT